MDAQEPKALDAPQALSVATEPFKQGSVPEPYGEEMPPPNSLESGPPPPAVGTRPVEPDALDAVRLEVHLEEFERRLRARSIELETELKAKERLRERVRELTRRIDELQETASALHREAVASTSLARELDATLKVACEARVQLGAALDNERSRRTETEERLVQLEAALTARLTEAESNAKRLSEERTTLLDRATAAEETSARVAAELACERESARALTAKAETQGDDARKSHEELGTAHRQVAALRQKTTGHEALIDSLRADLEQIRVARDEATAAASAALEKARAVENAEQIRREGVEAFEKARERGIRQEVEAERLRAECAEDRRRLSLDAETFKAKAEQLKVELRARADREIAEMRHALDKERARLYADVEAEREACGRSVPAPALDADSSRRLREEGSARRREIAREVESYLAPQAPESELSQGRVTEPSDAPAFQWDEEMRLLLWVAIGVGVVSALVGGAVLYQG